MCKHICTEECKTITNTISARDPQDFSTTSTHAKQRQREDGSSDAVLGAQAGLIGFHTGLWDGSILEHTQRTQSARRADCTLEKECARCY